MLINLVPKWVLCRLFVSPYQVDTDGRILKVLYIAIFRVDLSVGVYRKFRKWWVHCTGKYRNTIRVRCHGTCYPNIYVTNHQYLDWKTDIEFRPDSRFNIIIKYIYLMFIVDKKKCAAIFRLICLRNTKIRFVDDINRLCELFKRKQIVCIICYNIPLVNCNCINAYRSDSSVLQRQQ